MIFILKADLVHYAGIIIARKVERKTIYMMNMIERNLPKKSIEMILFRPIIIQTHLFLYYNLE